MHGQNLPATPRGRDGVGGRRAAVGRGRGGRLDDPALQPAALERAFGPTATARIGAGPMFAYAIRTPDSRPAESSSFAAMVS